jgi:CHASE3 domain sensor protein
MKTTSLSNRKTQFACGSAILAILAVGAISYRGMVVSSESDRWAGHTLEVIGNLEDLLFEIRGIESSYRGFVLTGKESDLESYRASILSAKQDEETIRNLTADNPEQQRRLPALEMLATQKIEFADMVIGLRRAKGLEASADAVRSGLGERTMEEFEGTVRELQNEERRLLVLRSADAKQRLDQTKIVLIVGTVLGSLIAAAAGWSV